MSYQAITDLIVNPQQIQEIQLSNTVKDSPKTNSSASTSFADLLSSYQQEQKTDSVKEEKFSETEPKETEKVPEKNDVKEEKNLKAEKSEKTEKSEPTEKDDVKTEKNQDKSDAKAEKTVKKSEKKLEDKDFARLNQLSEEKTPDENLVEAAQLAANVNSNEVKFDADVKEKLSESDENLIVEVAVQSTENITVSSNADVQNDAADLDFSKETPKEKKTFALDKDGKITVEDLRTEDSKEINTEKKSDLKITEIKQTSENTATMTMELNQDANANVLSMNNQTAASNGSNFQAMLNNQIQNNAPEFVKAGNIVLKDNNQGTINLVLHPDDLGNVKIHLSLDGKTLSGHITVATKEALQVFKDNSETLREAFIKNGFDTANFDVSLNNGGQFAQNMDFNQQNDGRNLMGKQVYSNNAAGLSSELENIIQNVEDVTNYSVNIVA